MDLNDALSVVNLAKDLHAVPTIDESNETITNNHFCKDESAFNIDGLNPVKLISIPLKDESVTRALKEHKNRRVSFSTFAQIITEKEIIRRPLSITGRLEQDRILTNTIKYNGKLETPRGLRSQPDPEELKAPKKTKWRKVKSFCSKILRKIFLKKPKKISNQESDLQPLDCENQIIL